MAKVIQPLMSLAARGKAGILIFNQWRSFNTVKLFKSPTQPNTAAQLTRRATMKAASGAWAGLTANQRAAWQQYAIDHLETDWTGSAKRLTAQNWYVRCYCLATLVGGAPPADPPTTAAPAAVIGSALACAGGAGTALTYDWTTPAAAGVSLIVRACGPISVGRMPRIEQSAILTTIASETVGAQQLYAAAVAGRYGFWITAIDEATGLASEPVYAEITVA